MEKTIEIPEGYEARIEGNKVILERKESEDERIRTCIVDVIKENDWTHIFGVKKEDCLAYLERQKEQKPAKFSIGDYVKDTNYQDEPIYEIVHIDSECYICEYRGPKSIGDRAIMHFSFNNPYLRIVPKPAEWSEEDERMRQDVIQFIETGWTDNGKSHLIPWLKSLPERFNLQPKQEWGEDDEEHINSILERLEGMCKKGATFTQTRFAVSEDKDWLKSLRHSWKPSEEQMKEYSYWYRNFIESGLASPSSKAVTVLGELLEHLKKL